MNVYGMYHANGLGQLSPTPAERKTAIDEISALYRTKLLGKQGGVAKMAVAKTEETQQTTDSSPIDEVTDIPQDELSRDMFLELLMEQIRNQDPLEPVSNEDMLAQLAQFSSLEQMENLNTSFEAMQDQMTFLNGNIDQLNFMSAQGMIGRYVEGVNSAGDPVSGAVDSVTLEESIVVLTVDGQRMPMTGVMAVASEPPAVDQAAGK